MLGERDDAVVSPGIGLAAPDVTAATASAVPASAATDGPATDVPGTANSARLDRVDRGDGAATSPGRALHSDPHDFAGLYIRHRSSFTLHARRYLRDPRDADEVVQESFLRLFLALPELETELQALAYCRRTITNLCIDRYRAQARRPNLVALDSVPVEDLAVADTGDPVIRAEDAATVREALSLLSPLHRAALVKREIEEKPLPQIAQELDIAEDSVKHVLFRARRALRRILATTSLAPGADGEQSGLLLKAMTKGTGGVAAVVLLLALGLGAGPDLRAIPVAGAVLPDLPSIGEIVKAVDKVLSGGDATPPTAAGPGGAAAGPQTGPQAGGGPGAPLVVASPSAAPAGAVSATSTVGLLPPRIAVLPGTAPSLSPAATPSSIPSPTAVPSVEPPRPVRLPAPSPVPAVVDTKVRDPKPAEVKPADIKPADPVKPADAAPHDTPASPKSDPATATGAPKDTPVSPAPKPKTSPDPGSWKTPGLVWQNDPTAPQQVVLAPAGDKPGFDS